MWQKCVTTARQMRLSLRTVKHRVFVYQATGGIMLIMHAHKSSRRRALSRAAADKAHPQLLNDSQCSSQMVGIQPQQEGITPLVRDKKTIGCSARWVGLELGWPILTRCRKTCRQLTQTNKNVRVAFCQSNYKRDWSNVIVTDWKRVVFHPLGTVVKLVLWMERGLC